MDVELRIKRFLSWGENKNHSKKSISFMLKDLMVKMDLSHRIRYETILNHIKKNNLSNSNILEVGSGSIGITRYFKKRVVGADLNFDGPKLPYLKPIECSATELPFENNEFDLAISIDMIEHLNKDERTAVIAEMLRVSKKWVIVTFPCGPTAKTWEEKAWRHREQKLKKIKNKKEWLHIFRRGNFLFEHRTNCLPQTDEILKSIENTSCSNIRTKVVRKHSVLIWYIMALAKINSNLFVRISSLILSNLLAPLIKRVLWCGHYREFFIIEKVSR